MNTIIKSLKRLTLVSIAFAMFSCESTDQTTEKDWNIVFILSDDLGWNQVAYHGITDFYETPNIDQIAREGMHFTNAYTANPVCSPTRASIMTGKNPARLHLTDFIPGGTYPYEKLAGPAMEPFLPINEKILPQFFKDKGYVTGIFGKWHLSPDRLFDEPGRFFDPQYRGFDEVLANAKPNADHDPLDDPHHVEDITQHSLAFLDAHHDKPFMMVVSHHVVHTPLIERPDLIAKYEAKKDPENRVENATMGAMIERMDEGIGRILRKIEDLGVADNTIVIFFSDNGGHSGQQSQAPLHGGKAMIFEGGIRVPLCVRWPGVVKPGTKSDLPVISDDFLPTFLDILNHPADRNDFDGRSIVSLLKGTEKMDREALYWHYPHYHNLGYRPGGAIRMGDYKLIEWYEETLLQLPNQILLYNLKEDISELKDLSHEMPELAAQMRRKLHEWRRKSKVQEMFRNPFHDPEKARF
ncbi:MAG: sulfatase [Cyclobacteriaceae bacterium]|nr:sulfatase [Cyclobacteriaceae bacterium]